MSPPVPDLAAAKATARERAREVLANLPADVRSRGGDVVARALLDDLSAHLKPTGGPVALFASLPLELSTAPLDARLKDAGVARAFPRVVDDALRFHLAPGDTRARDMPVGTFQVPTPNPTWPEVSLSACAVVVVPGLAFDDRGGRLGWGRGFYDRALRTALAAEVPPVVVAIGFDEQRVSEVPMGEQDVRVPALCTPALGVRRAIW